MKKTAAALMCSAVGLVINSTPAFPASTEFDQPAPSSSMELTDSQAGFGTAPGDDGGGAPQTVTPAPVAPEAAATQEETPQQLAQSHDPDLVDSVKAETAEKSELKPPIEPPQVAPKLDTPAAVIPEEPKPAVTVHDKKQPEVSEAPAAVPTNKARRHWLSGFGTGIIANGIQAMAQTPRAIGQYTASEYRAGVDDLTNNGKTAWLKGPAALISLPFSIGAGIAAGTAEAFTYQEVETTSPKLAESAKKSTQ